MRENVGGVPLVCVHGWPETKRVFWKVIEPLADAGFEVIVPDLRGFGDSGLGPDGFHDVASHSRDLYALVHDVLGHDRVVLLGGDLGGPVIQDLALRHPEWVDRMVLFNSPLPYLKDAMATIVGTRPPLEAADYFLRQGTDPDGLAADLATPDQRRRYIATFYTSRFWAHPGVHGGRRGGLPHRTVRRWREVARQLRRLRECLQRRQDRSRLCSRRTITPARWCCSDPATTSSTRPSIAWLLPCSATTSARSCCATAATSCHGRRRTLVSGTTMFCGDLLVGR